MLTRIKNIKGYIGRGCVHWDGKYSHRPCKCFIESVRVNKVYKKGGNGNIDEHEQIEFVLYNPRLHSHFTANGVELFDNFTECYRCICDYSRFEHLCDLGRYLGRTAEDVAKEDIERQFESAIDFMKLQCRSDKPLDEFRNDIVDACSELVKRVCRRAEREIDYGYLRRHTLYGFIMEMVKRHPAMDAGREHRMSEIKFKEDGNG